MVFLAFTSMIEAQEMTLEKAIIWGIEHNYDLQVIRHEIESLKNQLELLDTNEKWQIDLDVKPIWYFDDEDSSDANESQITLEATKVLPGDFNISTEISSENFNIKELSFGERRLLEQAMGLLTLELSFALDAGQAEIKKQIEDLYQDILLEKDEETEE
jgi:hypothetical protein